MRGDPLQLPGGQRPGRSQRLSPARRPLPAGGSPATLLLVLPGHPRQHKGYRRAPGLFPAPLADMAADELSHSRLGSPAALEDRTPLAFPPRLPLRTPPAAAAGPRSIECEIAAREEVRRAGDHRVLARTHPESPLTGAWGRSLGGSGS